ncbi:MAG: type 1 glutamine amidotransferase domain-containing protein [Oleiphilaceae bacterium]|nr:type 1 glutamine amidotransferase domain-containing protein [Oleiphilaceae bacterium]
MRVLMVLTSHSQLGETGHATGLWLEEFTTPYYTFKDAGADIVIASPKGGAAPIDPSSTNPEAQTETTERYYQDEGIQELIANTQVLTDMDAENFDAIFYPGGHGPLWDLANDEKSISLIETFWNQEKPIGAVCHGPAVFKSTKDESGQYIVSGRKVTGFSDSEEAAVELSEVVPFSVEEMLKANGGIYSARENWQEHIEVDGLLVTGQNPGSSHATADALLNLLK